MFCRHVMCRRWWSAVHAQNILYTVRLSKTGLSKECHGFFLLVSISVSLNLNLTRKRCWVQCLPVYCVCTAVYGMLYSLYSINFARLSHMIIMQRLKGETCGATCGTTYKLLHSIKKEIRAHIPGSKKRLWRDDHFLLSTARNGKLDRSIFKAHQTGPALVISEELQKVHNPVIFRDLVQSRPVMTKRRTTG